MPKSIITQEAFERIYFNELTPKQKKVLHLFLEGKSDMDIAAGIGVYHRSTASKHLSKISTLFNRPPEGDPDYRCELVRIFHQFKPELVSVKSLEKCLDITPNIRFPEGPENLNSPFYEERGDVEQKCCSKLQESGSLIRIKAPHKMGKTSLLKRIIAHAQKIHYYPIYLNLSLIEREKLEYSDQFLKSFYTYISHQLSEPLAWSIDSYDMWAYTEQMKSLLKKHNGVLVLVLDEVDRLFDYPNLYQNFFPMLRSWNEQAKVSEILENLRIVIAHSTQDYGKLNLNQSPFNVGMPIKLEDFQEKQVTNLALRHGLESTVVAPIMDLVGGNPFFTRLAFYYLSRQELSLNQILKNATNDSGIYGQYLREYLETFAENSELMQVFKQILTSNTPVKLAGKSIYQLERMGLIYQNDSGIIPSYRLYKEYFQQHLC
jgi:hypothetical protein